MAYTSQAIQNLSQSPIEKQSRIVWAPYVRTCAKAFVVSISIASLTGIAYASEFFPLHHSTSSKYYDEHVENLILRRLKSDSDSEENNFELMNDKGRLAYSKKIAKEFAENTVKTPKMFVNWIRDKMEELSPSRKTSAKKTWKTIDISPPASASLLRGRDGGASPETVLTPMQRNVEDLSELSPKMIKQLLIGYGIPTKLVNPYKILEIISFFHESMEESGHKHEDLLMCDAIRDVLGSNENTAEVLNFFKHVY
ncbi:MAG: hypothetical protein LBF56_01670 [Holosporales bacterium]|jgi:hypothetical protein|nr:hypothetical protein [Holosporales bacterium]